MKDERLRMMKPVVYNKFYAKWYPVRPKIEKYTIIDTIPKLRKLVSKAKKQTEFAFDAETNGLRAYGPDNNFRCVCITISWGPRDNYYIPLAHLRDEDIDRNLDLNIARPLLNKILGRKDVRLIGHNIKFDMHVLARIGVYIKTRDLFDTMVGVWLCDENTPNGLKESSKIKMDIDQTHFADAVATVPKEVKKRFGLKANSKATYDLVLIDDGAPYALDDSYLTWELYLGLLEELEHEEMDKIFYRHYMPFVWTLYHMEERGITVDIEKLTQMGVDMDKDLEDLMYQMTEIAGIAFNPSSQQLGELLFGYVKEDKLNEKTGKITKANPNWDIIKRSFKFRIISTTPKGAPQVSNDVLWKLSRLEYKNSKRKQQGVEFVKLLMSYNKIKKLKSAFVDGLLDQLYDDGKAHPSYNIIGTDTGRLSCTSPDLQQLPKADEEDQYQIRSVFIGSIDKNTGKRKKLIACDYANLEMRVLAHFSKDKNLIDMFLSGADTHGATAVNMFNLDCDPNEVKKLYHHLRQAAKTINFMLMYGGGRYRLYTALRDDQSSPIDLGSEEYLTLYAKQIAEFKRNFRGRKVPSDGEIVAQIYIDRYFESYKGVAEFIKREKRYAHRHGYVYTLKRRKRRIPDINSDNFGTVGYCERVSVNAPIQGSAADITSSAQNRVDSDDFFIEHGALLLLQVHDELVLECPEEHVEVVTKHLQDLMSHPFGDNVELNLPLRADADFGDSYQDAK